MAIRRHHNLTHQGLSGSGDIRDGADRCAALASRGIDFVGDGYRPVLDMATTPN